MWLDAKETGLRKGPKDLSRGQSRRSPESNARRWSCLQAVGTASMKKWSSGKEEDHFNLSTFADVVTRVGNVVQGIEVGFVRSVQPALQRLPCGLHERLTMVLDFDAADFAVERRI